MKDAQDISVDDAIITIDRQLCDPLGKGGGDAFYNFSRIMWSSIPGDPEAKRFVDCRYLAALCRVYQQIVEGKTPENVLINIPPSHSKSILANVLLPAYVWGPGGRSDTAWGHLSYDQSGVSRDSRKCRGLIMTDEYQSRWPLEILQGSNEVHYYVNAKGGYRYCNTIQGGITGKHFHFIVLDDPQNPMRLGTSEASEAAVEAQRARHFIDEVLPSRTLPGARFVTIMQRINEADAAQHILDTYKDHPEELLHVCLPLEYDPDVSSSHDWRTTEGELLSPERYDKEYWRKKFIKLPHAVRMAQYGQQPAAIGTGLIQKDELRYWASEDDLPTDAIWSVTLDAAQEGAATTRAKREELKRSWWVAQIILKHGPDRYVVRQTRFRKDFADARDHLLRFICDFADECRQHNRQSRRNWRPRDFIIERKAAGPALISTLKSDGFDLQGLSLVEFDPGSASKLARAEACLPVIRQGHVYVPHESIADRCGTAGMVDRICKFPRGRSDDEVDALCQALLYWIDDTGASQYRAKNLARLREWAANRVIY